MLSRLALRCGPLAGTLAKQQRLFVTSSQRCSSALDNWKEANELYYGPERDTKNFPHPVQPERPGPVRLGFIPDEWFTAFYDKTGVTGPYLFLGGLVTFLMSKEIWVIDHGFAEVLGFWSAVIFLNRKIGKSTAEYLDNLVEQFTQRDHIKPIENSKVKLQEGVADAEKAIWQEEGHQTLFEAKKEHVDFQLEAIYRERLNSVYQQVKKRLDYQLELENTQRRFEHQHMVNWITQSVLKGITPQQEKDSLKKCITDLKSLAATA